MNIGEITFTAMRVVAIIVIFVGALAIDTFAFHSRYRDAAWQTAKYHGNHFSYEVHHFMKKIGL